MRVAVTGAGGRLGSALVGLLAETGSASEVLAWDLPEHDLDDPASAGRLVQSRRPDVVIHCAAWTDVDGCAREPELALRRNGTATGEMAEACASIGASMVLISTNEVFDGRRMDRKPYTPADPPSPANAYGAAKLAGEDAARTAFGVSDASFATAAMRGAGDRHGAGISGDMGHPGLAIVRTAWLFGLPGKDFPQKILAAAREAAAKGRDLALVADEIGTPTYAPDLAAAIVSLLAGADRPFGRRPAGIHHIVNGGVASRADWGRSVLRLAGLAIPTREVPLSTWSRPSQPPVWGVLKRTPLPIGPLRHWHLALEDYMRNLGSREVQR
jgi:dTDP-4-dehydrorhamnose reductase